MGQCTSEKKRLLSEMSQERKKIDSGQWLTGIVCVMGKPDGYVFVNENQDAEFDEAWRADYRPIGFVKWRVGDGEDARRYVVTETSELCPTVWAKLMLTSAEEEVLEMFHVGNLSAALASNEETTRS